MKTNRIILGGGISGLICGVLDPSAIIITGAIGGVAKTENIAPFMIHFSWKAMHFLDAIQCPYKIATCKVGYFYKDKIRDELTAEQAKAYFFKSRGREPEPSDYEAKRRYEGDFLYLGTDLNGFITSMLSIIEKNRKRIRIHRIEKVNLDGREIEVEDGRKYHYYDELISTLPAYVFFHLMGRRDVEFTTKGKRFESFDEPKIDIKDYDYVYFTESNIKELRITKRADGKFTHEYPYKPLLDEHEEGGIVEYAYILDPTEIPKVKGVKFVGRYAEWDDKLLIHNVIERLTK